MVVGPDGLTRPAWASTDDLLREYYDTEWGMPVTDERGLFERISLEAFQAGLSWATILRKRPAFRAAFDSFDPDLVAAYGDADVERLLADSGIVRNRAKIQATIANARATVALRASGGLPALLWSFKPADTPGPGPSPRSRPARPNRPRCPGNCAAADLPSSAPPPCSRSWKPSASSTPTCWTPTAAAAPASGRADAAALRARAATRPTSQQPSQSPEPSARPHTRLRTHTAHNYTAAPSHVRGPTDVY